MSRSQSPTVSVIIPAYNEEDFIEEALQSVLDQTYHAVEIIVVDDGSTDATAERVDGYDNVHYYPTAHQGAPHARNVGASDATGEYLLFLDADDVLGAETLEGLLMAQNGAGYRKTLSVCDWAYLIQASSGEWVKRGASSAAFDPREEDALTAWLSGSFYPSCAVMWPSDLFEEVGGWDDSLVSNQDGDLVMRALVRGARVEKSSVGRSYYRRHAEGDRISDRRDADAFESRYRVLCRVESGLREEGRLNEYRLPLGRAFHRLATNFYRADETLVSGCERRAVELAGSKAVVGSAIHQLLYRTIGLSGKEKLRELLGGVVR